MDETDDFLRALTRRWIEASLRELDLSSPHPTPSAVNAELPAVEIHVEDNIVWMDRCPNRRRLARTREFRDAPDDVKLWIRGICAEYTLDGWREELWMAMQLHRDGRLRCLMRRKPPKP